MTEQPSRKGRGDRVRPRRLPRRFIALLALLVVTIATATAMAGANDSSPEVYPPPAQIPEGSDEVTVIGPDGELLRDENGELVTVDMRKLAEDGPPAIPPPAPNGGEPSPDDMGPPGHSENKEVETIPFYESEDFERYRN